MPVDGESTMSERRLHRLPLAVALAALVVGAGLPAAAQQHGGAQAGDPTVVITRTVHPRIAIRAVPKDELPIHAEATTFPQSVFQSTLATSLAPLVGDEALGETGSAGLVTEALDRAGLGVGASGVLGALPLGRAGNAGATPLGAGATIGGAVGRATGGLGDRVGGAVMQALNATKTGGGP